MSLFALFRSAKLLTQIVTLVAMFAAVAAAYYAWKLHVYNSGYNAAIAAIAAQDKKAVDAAKKARDFYRSCVVDGGVWDQQTGKCQRGRM